MTENAAGIKEKREQAGKIIGELAKEYHVDVLYDNYRESFVAAVNVAFRVAKQTIVRFARILKMLGNKSIEGLAAVSPTAANVATKIVGVLGKAGDKVGQVTTQVLSFIKDGWITRTIAILFVFRYVHNRCMGLDDSDMSDLQTETQNIFAMLITAVTPGPIGAVIKFCLNSITAALSFALLPIRVALGPVVQVCQAFSRRVEHQEAVALERQRKNIAKEEDEAALQAQKNSTAAAQLLRDEQKAQVSHLMEMQRLQQSHKAEQRRLHMKESVEKNQAKKAMEEQRAQYRKTLDEGKKERARREAAEMPVGAWDYVNGPFRTKLPLPSIVGSILGAPRRTAIEQEIHDQQQVRRKQVEASYDDRSYYKAPDPFDTGQAQEAEEAENVTPLSVVSQILSPGIELQNTDWRQTKRLGGLRPLNLSTLSKTAI